MYYKPATQYDFLQLIGAPTPLMAHSDTQTT